VTSHNKAHYSLTLGDTSVREAVTRDLQVPAILFGYLDENTRLTLKESVHCVPLSLTSYNTFPYPRNGLSSGSSKIACPSRHLPIRTGRASFVQSLRVFKLLLAPMGSWWHRIEAESPGGGERSWRLGEGNRLRNQRMGNTKQGQGKKGQKEDWISSSGPFPSA
jgi:hypothetical protein